MQSHRRNAQLGLIAAGLVFATSLTVLVMKSGGSETTVTPEQPAAIAPPMTNSPTSPTATVTPVNMSMTSSDRLQ
jgi:hypothetical protein